MNKNILSQKVPHPIFNSLSIQTYQSSLITTDSQPLICFHGWLDNSGSFLPLTNLFPELPWYLVDLMGHGHSSWRPEGSFYYFWDYLCDAAALIQQHFPQGVHLVGHSLGSGIALLIAGLLPKLSHSVTLFDGFGPLVAQPGLINQEFRFSMQQYQQPSRPVRCYHSLEAMALSRQKRHQITFDSCLTLAKYGHNNINGELSWSFDPKLFILPPFQMIEEQVLAMIAAIKAPVLLLQAEQGFKVDPSFFEQRRKTLQHVLEHHIVSGHHHTHLDNPENITPLLKNFWRKNGIL